MGQWARMVFSKQVFFLPNLLQQFMKQKLHIQEDFFVRFPLSYISSCNSYTAQSKKQ